jgi:hypothetical protein
MSTPHESEARRALNRFLRALEKAERELESLEDALREAEGSEFPAAGYESAAESLRGVRDFAQDEGRRLQRKILSQGGIEPGRLKRFRS